MNRVLAVLMWVFGVLGHLASFAALVTVFTWTIAKMWHSHWPWAHLYGMAGVVAMGVLTCVGILCAAIARESPRVWNSRR